MPKEIQIGFTCLVYEHISEMESQDAQLLTQARQACFQAYAPYSNFLVGAALLLDTGETVTGVNQENAAYPSGLCAERVALYASGAKYPQAKILSLAIAARRRDEAHFFPSAPCGACRQVMIEFQERQNSSFNLIFQGDKQQIIKCPSGYDLLPLVFNSSSLNAQT